MVKLFIVLELLLCIVLFGFVYGLIFGSLLAFITVLFDSSARAKRKAEEKRHQDHKEQQENIKALQRELIELRKAQERKNNTDAE